MRIGTATPFRDTHGFTFERLAKKRPEIGLTTASRFPTLNLMPRSIQRRYSAKPTRRGILDKLKINGPCDPTRLAALLGVSPMAVRQHLYALRKQRLVTFRIDPRPFGRPAKVWRLAPAAEALFPDMHSALCVSLLDSLFTAFGPEGLHRTFEIQSRRQVEFLVSSLAPHSPFVDRLNALVTVRTNQGYLAALQDLGEGDFLIIENHCPIRCAAGVCPSLCDAELRVFQSALGNQTTVERREHILTGDRRCTYLVRHPHVESPSSWKFLDTHISSEE